VRILRILRISRGLFFGLCVDFYVFAVLFPQYPQYPQYPQVCVLRISGVVFGCGVECGLCEGASAGGASGM